MMSRDVLRCVVMSRDVLCCDVMSCDVMCCVVLCCVVLLCVVLCGEVRCVCVCATARPSALFKTRTHHLGSGGKKWSRK